MSTSLWQAGNKAWYIVKSTPIRAIMTQMTSYSFSDRMSLRLSSVEAVPAWKILCNSWDFYLRSEVVWVALMGNLPPLFAYRQPPPHSPLFAAPAPQPLPEGGSQGYGLTSVCSKYGQAPGVHQNEETLVLIIYCCITNCPEPAGLKAISISFF